MVAGLGEVARLGSGEILGEISFVDTSSPSATVTTFAPTQVLAIDRERLFGHLASDPAFAARFYLAVAMYISVRMRETMQRFGRDTSNAEEELNMDLLHTVHIAGARSIA
jgi:CRP-like cAMP-binding protein